MSAVKVASLKELQESLLHHVTVSGTDVLLIMLADGVHAVSDTCTHAGISLADGWLEGDVICCPKHGGKFNVKSGKAVAFPAIKKLPRYEVSVDGDDIYVDVE